jgi:protein-S-isoprenylcysteine O-methyltransferase Ste14
MLKFTLPPHAWAALAVLALFEVQSYLRFGAKARKMRAGASDHGSTLILTLAFLWVALGFLTVQRVGIMRHIVVPDWILWPGPSRWMVNLAWTGIALAVAGLVLRVWAVLTLRHRYTRTLLIDDGHLIERGGPYRFVRHPGYLGSLLCINGFALASTSLFVVVTSLAAISAAYAYRIHIEDRMLVAHFGAAYEQYRREVAAVIPFFR